MSVTKIMQYQCLSCSAEYNRKEEAQHCCVEAIYACPNCEKAYEYEEEAIECCDNVGEIQWYSCDECDEYYETEQLAQECTCEEDS